MPPKVKQTIKEEVLNKLKKIGYKFDNYCVFVPNKEKWEKEKFQRDIWYLIIYHRFDEVTYLEINFSEKTFKKYIERNNYREAMCPEEEWCEKIDMPLIDDEEEIFFQLGWLKELSKERKEKLKEQEEQKIFKEFEELGYKVCYNKNVINTLVLYNDKQGSIINVFNDKTYSCKYADITLQEHQLLHKLFELWGWFDE